MGYTKEFLVEAYLHRFLQCSAITIEQLLVLEQNAIKCFDQYGRDKFRDYAALSADKIKEYKAHLSSSG